MRKYYSRRGQKSFFELDEPLSKLPKGNRWVVLGDRLPWEAIEQEYNKRLSNERCGAGNKPARMVVGALIIKHMLRLSDVETIQAIQENPYMQYLVGLKYFLSEPIFDASLFVMIRKRLDEAFFSGLGVLLHEDDVRSSSHDEDDNTGAQPAGDAVGEEGEEVDVASPPLEDTSSEFSCVEAQSQAREAGEETGRDAPTTETEPHRGTLKIDATCCEAEMRYPTDYNLLEDGSKLIDCILRQVCERYRLPMPHTHREEARRAFLRLSHKKRKRKRLVDSVKLVQLRCLQADIQTFLDFFGKYTSELLSAIKGRKAKWLRAVFKMFKQQRAMFDEGQRTCADRIVSIFQPHVRPIVRGKAKAMTEFGAKVGASIVDGYTFIDHISWDAYNECTDLPLQIALYKKRFGYLPVELQADKLYLNRANRAYLKQLGIKCHCAPLGRPPKHPDAPPNERRRASGERNEIEATFGTAKRIYGANNIRAKLPTTATSWICCCFLAKNIKRFLGGLFALFSGKPSEIPLWSPLRALLPGLAPMPAFSTRNLVLIIQ